MSWSLARVELAALALAAAACNVVFGVDELEYHTPAANGGASTTTTTSGATTTATAGGANGGFGGNGNGGDGGGNGGAGPAYASLGYAVENGAGSQVDVTVNSTDVPPGALIVALLAGRGSGPCSVSDAAGHTWVKAIEQTNGSDTAVVAAFHTTANNAFGADNSVSAATGNNGGEARALLLLHALSAKALVTAASAQTTGAQLSAITSADVGSPAALVVALTATGHNTAAMYTAGAGHEMLATYATSYSSGAFFAIDAQVGMPASFSATTSNVTGQSASVVAVFE